MPKPKLELTWIGKEIRPRLEPRIFIEDPEKSYHAKYRIKKSTTEITEYAEGKKRSVSPSSSSVTSVPSVVNPSSGDLFDNKHVFSEKLPRRIAAKNAEKNMNDLDFSSLRSMRLISSSMNSVSSMVNHFLRKELQYVR